MNELKRFSHIPGMSRSTLLLIDKLKDGTPGDQMTDKQLTEECGRDTAPDGKGYSNLMTAVRYCIRNHRVHWERSKGENIMRCCEAKDTIGVARSDLKRNHRRSRQAMHKLNTIDLENAEDAVKSDTAVLMAQHGMLLELSSAKATKTLSSDGAADRVDPKKLLESLK